MSSSSSADNLRDAFDAYGEDPRVKPIYSVNEVAHHLGVPASTVRSWVKSRGGPVPFQRVIVPADGKGSLLSFQNLIEVHVLSALRSFDIPLPKVREAIGYLRADFGTAHPLADVELHTDRTDLFIRHLNALVSLTRGGQVAIEPVLERYLERVDRERGMLRRLYPFIGDPATGERAVAIDPLLRFGKPYLVGVGVETSAIASRFRAGDDNIKALAADFHATEHQITTALRYERLLDAAA